MRLAPPPEEPEEPGPVLEGLHPRHGARLPQDARSTQLGEFIAPTWQALVDGARYVDERLAEIFVERRARRRSSRTTSCAFPAIPASGPTVGADRLVQPARGEGSAAPARRSPACPLDDRSGWERLPRRVRARRSADAAVVLGVLRRARRAAAARARAHPRVAVAQPDALSGRARLPPQPPARADLAQPRDVRPRDRRRRGRRRKRDGRALVYLSLGSLGSADVELMQRLVAVLADTPHRYIVSKGPQHAKYELAGNMVGAEFLPQASVLPHVDAVITHGGNNTTTECMWFGKPMLVAADLLGPARQRAARARDRVRDPAADLRVRRDERARGCARARARGRAAACAVRRGRRAAPRRPGTALAADLIERLATS